MRIKHTSVMMKNSLVLLPPAVRTLAVIAWLTAHLSFPCLLVFSALTTPHHCQVLAHSTFQHTESNYAFFLIWTAFRRNWRLELLSALIRKLQTGIFFSFYKSRRIALYRSAWLRQSKCSLKINPKTLIETCDANWWDGVVVKWLALLSQQDGPAVCFD